MSGIVAPLFRYQKGMGNQARSVLDDFGASLELLTMENKRMQRACHVNSIVMQAIKASARVNAALIDVVLLLDVDPECDNYSEFFEVREQDKLYGPNVVGRRWSEFASVLKYMYERESERSTVMSHFDCIRNVKEAISRPRWHSPFEDSELDNDLFKSPTMFTDKLTETGLSGLISMFAKGEMPNDMNDIVNHIGGIDKLTDLMEAYANASSTERSKYAPIVNQLLPLLSVIGNKSPNPPQSGMTGFQTHIKDALDEFTSDDLPLDGIKGAKT